MLGPTATGKTRLAALLANKIDAEIISADSRQVYKNMNLGTGKDYDDYIVYGKSIPYHLIDIHEPGYKYNVYEFQSDFFKKFEEIKSRKKEVILCGGTGMYIESITKGYKLISVPVNNKLRNTLKDKNIVELEQILQSYKRLHNRSDTDTIKRAIRAIEIAEFYSLNKIKDEKLPEISPVFLGISFDREKRRQRITERLKIRLRNGMVEEVESLLNNGATADDMIYYGLEYKFITLYLQGVLSFSDMEQKLNIAIHQFAKRQTTWFRKMEREGVEINWIDGLLDEDERTEMALKIISKGK